MSILPMQIVLAACTPTNGIPCPDQAKIINNASGVFEVVQSGFFLIGLIITIMVVWRAVQGFLGGDLAKVARTIIFGGLAAILCFDLNLGVSLVQSGTGLVSKVVSTISNTVGGDAAPAESTGTPATGAPAAPPAPPLP